MGERAFPRRRRTCQQFVGWYDLPMWAFNSVFFLAFRTFKYLIMKTNRYLFVTKKKVKCRIDSERERERQKARLYSDNIFLP